MSNPTTSTRLRVAGITAPDYAWLDPLTSELGGRWLGDYYEQQGDDTARWPVEAFYEFATEAEALIAARAIVRRQNAVVSVCSAESQPEHGGDYYRGGRWQPVEAAGA